MEFRSEEETLADGSIKVTTYGPGWIETLIVSAEEHNMMMEDAAEDLGPVNLNPDWDL